MLKKLTGIILLCCSHSVFALTIDVGMLTLAEGNVEIVSGQNTQHPATAFFNSFSQMSWNLLFLVSS